VLKNKEGSKCRSNQKDGIWRRAHHRGIRKPRRFPSSYTSRVKLERAGRRGCRTVDRAAAHIRNCELGVGSCHRRNHGGGSGDNHGHGYSRRHFLLNFASLLLGGPYHSRRQAVDVLDEVDRIYRVVVDRRPMPRRVAPSVASVLARHLSTGHAASILKTGRP
jgi:hypothetical protein